MPSPLFIDTDDYCRSWAEAAGVARGMSEDVVAALDLFLGFLGQKWPGWAGGRHLARQFFLRLQGRPPEGMRLAKLIEALQRTPGIDAVVAEVGGATWQSYKHGVMALEIAAGLSGRGCKIRFVARTNNTTPDLEVRLVDRPVTLELKALHEPDDEEPWHALERRISIALARVGLNAGVFDLDLEWSAIDNPDAVFEGLLGVAAAQSSSYVPLPDGTGKARLSASNVCLRTHPGHARYDVDRILGNLRRWSNQVATEGQPTMVVVHTRDLYRPFSNLGRYEAVAAVADVVARRLLFIQEVSAVLLYEDSFEPPSAPVRIQHPLFEATSGSSSGGMLRSTLLVLNPRAAVAMRPDERAVLMQDPSAL
jgi:hypothetical protein